MQIMGKQDRTPPDENSVDELLSSIRQAIEADTADQHTQPVNGSLRPLRAPRAPHVSRISHDNQQQDLAAPSNQAATKGDDRPGPGYHSAKPYRYRHSLETSESYMSLRNRLASLKSRTRSGTSRSMASLLGGDVRQEEARARDQQQQLLPHHVANTPVETDLKSGLKTSIDNEQVNTDELTTSDMSSGVVSYTPDYSDWSLENSLTGVATPDSDASVQKEVEPLVTTTKVSMDAAAEDVSKAEGAVEAGKSAVTDAVSAAEETEEPAGIPLEEMVRQVIEPELVTWIDEHLPDQVASAMPDEEAFTAMIKPMIETWLADNLSPIVEVAVREEIARITGLKR
jgi:cell pole-organizing protein PopZ